MPRFGSQMKENHTADGICRGLHRFLLDQKGLLPRRGQRKLLQLRHDVSIVNKGFVSDFGVDLGRFLRWFLGRLLGRLPDLPICALQGRSSS